MGNNENKMINTLILLATLALGYCWGRSHKVKEKYPLVFRMRDGITKEDIYKAFYPEQYDKQGRLLKILEPKKVIKRKKTKKSGIVNTYTSKADIDWDNKKRK